MGVKATTPVSKLLFKKDKKKQLMQFEKASAFLYRNGRWDVLQLCNETSVGLWLACEHHLPSEVRN